METKQFILSFVFVIGTLVGVSSGLKCWECENDLNWEKCKMLQTKVCTWPQTQCGKFYTKQGAVETYRRDCFTEEYCQVKPQCTSQFDKCEISCCKNDACNNAVQKTASFLLPLLLLLSTLLVFII